MEIILVTRKTIFLILQILILLNVSFYLVHCTFSTLQLKLQTSGPDSAAFDPKGDGPYACVGDGRVIKYQDPNVGFTEFAITSPNRTKKRCDGTNDPISQLVCGRPYGLGFYDKTGDLYITDAYYGLVMAKPSGGLVTPVATSFEGAPFAFLDSLDIDEEMGIIYFVDSGAIFRTGNGLLIALSGDTTGRLFKYDIATKQVTLLLNKLSGPAGIALSKDKSYLLVSETIAKKIRRFWLIGAKANSSDVFANIDGNPDNIKRTELGDFWVAVVSIKLKYLIIPAIISTGQRMNEKGEVVETRDFTAQFKGINGITEVQEHNCKLYVGSLDQKFIGVDEI